MSSYATPEPRADDDLWHDIDQRIEVIAELAAAGLPHAEFYHQLLEHLTALVPDSVCAALWQPQDGVCRHPSYAACRSGGEDDTVDPLDASWIRRLEESRQPAAFPRSAASGVEELSLVAPVPASRQPALLELRIAGDFSEIAVSNRLELLAAIAELAGDYERRRVDPSDWSAVHELALALHRDLDLDATCFAIANEGRRVLQCDRVSVFVYRGRKARLQAVSGMDHFDRRAEAVQAAERLATLVSRHGEPLWAGATTDEIPEPIEDCLQAHSEISGARSISVRPLTKEDSSETESAAAIVGVVLLEHFTAHEFGHARQPQTEACLQHCGAALWNASRHSRIPRWLRVVAGGRARVGRLLGGFLALACAAAVTAALFIVESDFVLDCRGELRPAVRRHIFAPADGAIEQLNVEPGAEVRRGDLLLVLRSSELLFDQSRLAGELDTHRAHLRSVTASLATVSLRGEEGRARRRELAAEEQRFTELIASGEKQLEILRKRLAELEVRAPIDGEVLTRNLGDRLIARPIQRGQKLLTLANTTGPWLLELQIAEHDVGHAMTAADNSSGLALSYRLITEPDVEHRARIESIGNATQRSERGELIVPATATVEQRDGLRSGTTVFGRIHCGRRSLAFIWTRDLIEMLRTNLFI